MVDTAFDDELYRKVAHVLQYGLRTSTYKLATMSAIIEFSASRHLPRGMNFLDAPLTELAQRVMALYWNQLMPLDGKVLRQSTQPQSRIFDAIESLRSAADCPEDDQTYTTAAQLAPGAFRRAVDDVAVCLAQQPLPRLQRVAGAPKSDTFLYDDSFLHDRVTQTELARNRNCIRLKGGVPEGLARRERQLHRLVRSMWLDDVLRMNAIPDDQRARVDEHLFGKALNQYVPTGSNSKPDSGITSTFATRIGVAAAQPASPTHRQAVPSDELGKSPHLSPSLRTTPASADQHDTATTDDAWGQVFGDNLNEIISASEVRTNGCWIRPSNSPVRCRPPGDTRRPLDLPKMGLHRWAWMVANGYSKVLIPAHLVHVQRTCKGWTCCNPEHLAATSASGAPLSKTVIDSLVRKVAGSSVIRTGRTPVPVTDGQLVLQADLAWIRNHCSVKASGCWLAPTNGPVACRPQGDARPAGELQKMAPHRWVWMVAHGRSSNPLPGNFYVRKRCGEATCCRPDHLYLTTAQGEELMLREAEAILARQQAAVHRSFDSDRPLPEVQLFARQLNAIFQQHTNRVGRELLSAEVAADLQEDGFSISASLIDRLRSGAGELPTSKTIEALAYFFSVDTDYFSGHAPSNYLSAGDSADGLGLVEDYREAPSVRMDETEVDISLADVGIVIANLSMTISECLAQDPADHYVSDQLVPLLGEISELLSAQASDVAMPQSLLRRILAEWNPVGGGTRHQTALEHLSEVAGDPPIS